MINYSPPSYVDVTVHNIHGRHWTEQMFSLFYTMEMLTYLLNRDVIMWRFSTFDVQKYNLKTVIWIYQCLWQCLITWPCGCRCPCAGEVTSKIHQQITSLPKVFIWQHSDTLQNWSITFEENKHAMDSCLFRKFNRTKYHMQRNMYCTLLHLCNGLLFMHYSTRSTTIKQDNEP